MPRRGRLIRDVVGPPNDRSRDRLRGPSEDRVQDRANNRTHNRAHNRVHDRPRERLERLGAEALTAEELLALVLGSGGTVGSATVVARAILGHCQGSLHRLARTGPAALRAVPGVGPATSTRVVAAVELGRRIRDESWTSPTVMRGAADVHRFMEARLRDLVQEEFHALLLNAQHGVLRDVTVTRGLLDASLVHPREVFRTAIQESAAAVILVHNHPSGDPTPSAEDFVVTRQMKKAGEALGIPVLDHVVIAGGGYRSLSAGAAV